MDKNLEGRIDELYKLGFKFQNGNEYVLEIPNILYANFALLDLRTYSDEKFNKELNNIKEIIKRNN